ncbi:MAG: glycosyltransferase family 2 protein [Clostridia bacterium]|nr:glycosyltransferase family 2 protein [Clostridia bacterium]
MSQISVIVPIYNVEKYLHRCVDSILAQTFTDFELILIDDGSPDRCGAICDEYASQDSRVYVIHQKNGGVSAVRNAGIDWVFANSDSQWISFVDSDDWVHPQMLEQLYWAVQEHDVKVSICGYRETAGDEPWEDGEYASKLWPVEQYYVDCNINATVPWGKLYHCECFRKIRYPVGKIHEDEYVTYRILFEYDQVAVIDAPLYAYFVNPQGITKSEWTVKRLDALGARRQQICFLKENRYLFAYDAIARVSFAQTYQYSQEIGAYTKLEKWKAQMKIRSYLKWLLRKNREVFPFVEKNIWIYEMVFPFEMWFYWYGKAMLKRLMRRDDKHAAD